MERRCVFIDNSIRTLCYEAKSLRPMRYITVISRKMIIICAIWRWWRKNVIVNSLLHSGGDCKDVALPCTRDIIEKLHNMCTDLQGPWQNIMRHVAELNEISSRYHHIGQVRRREIDKEKLQHLLLASKEAKWEFAVWGCGRGRQVHRVFGAGMRQKERKNRSGLASIGRWRWAFKYANWFSNHIPKF